LGALKWIALGHDTPALALRGVAMAQLGELAKTKVLSWRAVRSFAPRERVDRARCVTAEADVALAARDLRWPTHALDEARRTFGAANYRSFAPTPFGSTIRRDPAGVSTAVSNDLGCRDLNVCFR
jgi:hypothetical protein